MPRRNEARAFTAASLRLGYFWVPLAPVKVFAGITHRAEQDAVAGTPQLVILRTQGIAVGLQTGDTADYIIIMERVPKFLCDPLQYLDTFVDDFRTNSIPGKTAILFSMAGTLPIFIRYIRFVFVQFHYTKAYHVREIPKQKGYLQKSYGGLSLRRMPSELSPGAKRSGGRVQEM